MPDYKKHYAHLVGAIDEALTLMDTDNFLQWYHVKSILQNALLEAEKSIINEPETTKILKIR